MKTLVVGGAFNSSGGCSSTIVNMLAHNLGKDTKIINGGTLEDLKINCAGYQLIIWMPSIPNDVDKTYPTKDKGAVLICSKAMRPEHTHFDSISRIFKMNANAVIEINNIPHSGRFSFRLIDALGNTWEITDEVACLAQVIHELTKWTICSIRLQSISSLKECPAHSEDLYKLMEITRHIADKVEVVQGSRYFGNASTRCMKMFPSARNGVGAFMSARNIDKRRIEVDDFVFCQEEECVFTYKELKDIQKVICFYGSRKPSVDTGTQLELYQELPEINFMVHGHAHIKGARCTANYYPCGDLREIDEVLSLVSVENQSAVINLVKHGFIILSDSIETLKAIVENSVFESRLPK